MNAACTAPLRRCKIALVVMISASWCSCRKQKEVSLTNLDQFEAHLLRPAPPTISDVRYACDLMGDPSYYLAFRCSPADVDRIIKENGFATGKPLLNETAPAKWWQLTELGYPVTTYSVTKPRSAMTLWVNESQNHCYYAFWGL